VIRNEGLMNTASDQAGVIDTPIQLVYTDAAVLIGMAYVYLPLMVLPLFAAIDRFDMRLLEAGYDLYASRMQVLRRVILPIVKPGIIAGSILVFVPSLGAYVTPRVLGGGKNMMIGNFIELQFLQGRKLAPWRGAVDDAADHRDGRAAGLCPRRQQGEQPAWLSGVPVSACRALPPLRSRLS
jgi:ABC-type spermidine/putrescine transport system permease subunit I